MPSMIRAVNFGLSRSGLATVGYRLAGATRVTAGVAEVLAGSGIYSASIAVPAVPGYVLWDTGVSPLAWAVEDLDVAGATSAHRSANFGLSRSGLTTVGYMLRGQPRATAGVAELAPGSGVYGALVTPPPGYAGPITWDTGDAQPAYAEGVIDLDTFALPPGTQPDFLAALTAWLTANPTVAALFPRVSQGANSAEFAQAATLAGSLYPYCALTQVAGRTGGGNTGKGYWEDRYYRLAVYSDDQDQCVTVARVLGDEADSLTDNRLTFADGYQMKWWRTTPPLLMQVPGSVLGLASSAPLWSSMLTYHAQIGRKRK